MDRNNEFRLVFEADPLLTYMEKGNGEDRTIRISMNNYGIFFTRWIIPIMGCLEVTRLS